MSIKYNRKIEVIFTKEERHILDGQSKICNWLYNRLLETCQKDYRENNSQLQLMKDENLRNYAVAMKSEYPFLKTVFSSPIKEVAERLKTSYERFFKKLGGYPNFRSWKQKWFSLFYDEPNKGWKLEEDGVKIKISLGDIPELPRKDKRENPSITGHLTEQMILQEGESINTFRLCKQQGNRFYAVFTIERCSSKELAHKKMMSLYRKEYNLAKKENREKPTKPVLEKEAIEIPKDVKWIALDPNHKNFFVGVDNEGNSILFKKLAMIKYWDKMIDKLKSKRDICEKNYRKKKTKNGIHYTVHSPRWNRLNQALNRAYHKRREQIKVALYSIAHELYRRYDLVLIGDYTPTNGTAPFDNMKRSMLNQEKIGEFRNIVEWVAIKKDSYYKKVNEHNTTKNCCVCGHQEKKTPDIRQFTCVSCGTTLMRDNNSAVNIASKEGFTFNIEALKHKLSSFAWKGIMPVGQKVQWNENNTCLARTR